MTNRWPGQNKVRTQEQEFYHEVFELICCNKKLKAASISRSNQRICDNNLGCESIGGGVHSVPVIVGGQFTGAERSPCLNARQSASADGGASSKAIPPLEETQESLAL